MSSGSPAIELSTYLPATPEQVWEAVQQSALLDFVAAPLMVFVPVSPPAFPKHWVEGDYLTQMRLFNLLPLGQQVIAIRDLQIQREHGWQVFSMWDRGHGRLIRRWHHLITLSAEGQGTQYTDTVYIDAGWLTGLVTLFARVFYTHRQRRWRALMGQLHRSGQ